MAEYVKTFVKTACISIPVTLTVLDIFGYVSRVDGSSMEPTLNPRYGRHDYVFLSTWRARKREYERGDVISLISPRNPRQRLVKRIVGLEGDTVTTLSYKNRVVQVPEGHCWVEGDHYGHSLDSNMFGPIPLGLIKAKVTHVVWPPSRVQALLPVSPGAERVEVVDHYKNYTSNSKNSPPSLDQPPLASP